MLEPLCTAPVAFKLFFGFSDELRIKSVYLLITLVPSFILFARSTTLYLPECFNSNGLPDVCISPIYEFSLRRSSSDFNKLAPTLMGCHVAPDLNSFFPLLTITLKVKFSCACSDVQSTNNKISVKNLFKLDIW